MSENIITTAAEDPEDGRRREYEKQQAQENANFINGLLYGDNLSSKNLSADENKLTQLVNHLVLIEETISKKQDEINSSGSISVDGKNRKLSTYEKAKLRNEIRNLRNMKGELKVQISKLNKKVKVSYKMNAQKSAKVSLRISARGDGYHRRNGGAIENAITNMVKAMDADNLTALKAELANLDAAKGDTLLMRSLSKAPHNLQTKVVTNSAAREGYLQYFRNELGTTKKAPKGKRRK